MPEGRLERTRQAYKPPVVGSYEWAIECERVRLALAEPWYDIGAIPYNPFGKYGTNYADKFTTGRDLGDETAT